MFARPAFIGTLLRFTVIPVLNIAAFSLESMLTSSNDQFAANFSALAKK
jgi:hypothetical protein